MIDVSLLKQHLRNAGAIGHYTNRTLITYNSKTVLLDMEGPVDINNGQNLTAVKMEYDPSNNEIALARSICQVMESNDHDAFAFYQLKENDGKHYIRYGSIKLQTKPST